MHVAGGQQLPLPSLKPAQAGVALAPWAMPVTARVIRDGSMSAVRALIAMSTQRGGSAARDGQQAGSEAVTQGMRMDVLARKPGALRGALTGCPKNLGTDRIAGRVPSVTGKQPVRGLAPQSAPVNAQCLEQLRAERDIAVLAVLAALAAADVNDHALAVDVVDLQVRHFCATCACAIVCHQQDAMKGELRRVDQTRYFLRAEYLRQVQNFLRVRSLGDAPASF